MYNLFTMPSFYYSNFLLEDGLSDIYVYDVNGRRPDIIKAQDLPVWIGSDGSGFENDATKDALKSFIKDVFKVPDGYTDEIIRNYESYLRLEFRPSLSRKNTSFTFNFGSYRFQKYNADNFDSSKFYMKLNSERYGSLFPWINFNSFFDNKQRSISGFKERVQRGCCSRHWEENQNLNLISKLAKEKYGKDFGKKVGGLEASFNTTWLYNPTIKLSYNDDQPLFSAAFDLYYTRDELSRVKKFSVKQNDLPFPLLKSFKYSRRAGGEYSFDLNKEERLSIVEFYKKVFLPNDSSVESRLKKIREELEKKKLD